MVINGICCVILIVVIVVVVVVILGMYMIGDVFEIVWGKVFYVENCVSCYGDEL